MAADVEIRIVAHNRWALKREPALGAMYERHVPKYKPVWEGYSNECVTPDYEISSGKPQHLITRDEQWASHPENKREGMKRRHKDYLERCGSNDREVNEQRLKD